MEFLSNLNFAEISGVIAAVVLFFDRLAKLIPTKSLGKIIGVLQKVTAILGVKVEDKQ